MKEPNPLMEQPLSRVIAGRFSRRDVLKRAGALTLGTPLVLSLLAACGGDDDDDGEATATTAGGQATATTGAGAPTATTAAGGPTATTGAGAPTATTGAGAPTATTAQPATTGTEGEPQTGGTWTLVLAQEPDTLDSHKQGSYVAGVVQRYIGDTLVEKNPDTSTIDPALAVSYEISEDGLTTTFTLQDGILFHNGKAVDAAAVKACYDRALDPATQSAVTIGQLGPIDTITAIDAKTVEFKHKNSYSVFLDNMAHPVCSILDAEAAAAAGDDYGRNPVLTGPWKMVEWQAANVMRLERNTDYNWAPSFAHKGATYIDEIVIRFFPEAATALTSFEAGEVDQVEIPQADIERIKENSDWETIEFFRPGATFMEFNVTKAPFDDVTVRKAFNYAIDREAVLETAIEGYGRLLYAALPQSIWGWWEGSVDYAYKYDPEMARQTFAEAGWELDGDTLKKDGQPFTFTLLMTAGQAASGPGSQVIQAQLKEFGIDMQIEAIDFSTVITRLKAGDYQASWIGYAYASPDIVYIWFHSANIGTGLTLSQYSNPELDKLIEDSRSVVDEAKRLELYMEIQKHIIDNAIWVPLYEASTTYGLTKRIAGHKIHPDGHLHLQEAYITDL
jgi:peptide/nickel transport system substrate-binding protein